MTKRIVRRIAGAAGRGMMRLLATARRDGLLPVAIVRAIRRLSVVTNALVPPNIPVDGSSVRDPELARMLRGVELGVWSLGPRSIDFLGELMARHQPSLVVEFGSGVSTLALAHFLSRLSPTTSVRLVALEQDEGHAEATRTLLRSNGLAEAAAVIHSPILDDVIEGKASIRYTVTPEFFDALGDRSPDFILVDGPVADTGGRFATLPLLRSFVRQARFVMDDAIRDSELQTAADWSRLSFVTLEGIKPIEKGLLLGTFGDR